MILAENTTPSDVIALFICLAFAAYSLRCVIEGMNNPEEHAFSDKFDVGYTSETTTATYEYEPVEAKAKIKVKSKKPTAPVISTEKEAIQKNCVLALRSLGYNKADAREQVKEFFEENNPKDVEDFLQDYMSKQRNQTHEP